MRSNFIFYCLLCCPHWSSALLGIWVHSFNLAYIAGLTDQCKGFREWPLRLCRVPLQQKDWKHCDQEWPKSQLTTIYT